MYEWMGLDPVTQLHQIYGAADWKVLLLKWALPSLYIQLFVVCLDLELHSHTCHHHVPPIFDMQLPTDFWQDLTELFKITLPQATLRNATWHNARIKTWFNWPSCSATWQWASPCFCYHDWNSLQSFLNLKLVYSVKFNVSSNANPFTVVVLGDFILDKARIWRGSDLSGSVVRLPPL